VKSIAGLLLAAGILVLFGCGGGGGDSSLTKAEFTKQVNQACRQEAEARGQAKAGKEKELKIGHSELATPSEHKQIVEATLVPYEKMTAQMEELVPSDQAENLEPVIEAREEVAEIVREQSSANATLPVIKKANDLAREFGLDECST
jgi:hypothetical protein